MYVGRLITKCFPHLWYLPELKMPRLDLLNVVVLLGRLQPPDHVDHGIDDLDDHDGVDRLGEEHEWATTELRNSLRSIEWDLEDLEDTVQVVRDHANYANLEDQ